MKSIITLIFVCLIFVVSCDPSFCYNYTIENKTDKNIELIKFTSDSTKVDDIITIIYANNNYTVKDNCSLGGRRGINYNGNDSIQMKADGVLVKTYYPSDKGKSIFKTHPETDAFYSWKLVEFKRDYEKYVFEITEEDLK